MAFDGRRVDVLGITSGQPFCAGVILRDGDHLLVTLNPDGLPSALEGHALRLGGVGGGQESGESIVECARREACEELAVERVTLVSSPLTVVGDLDTGSTQPVSCLDAIAPLLVQRQRRLAPDVPYRPGLPTGPYVYFALYLARLPAMPVRPGDDVRALLWLPLDVLDAPDALAGPIPLRALLGCGATLLADAPLDPDTPIWTPPEESMRTVAALLRRHPELARLSVG